MDSNGELRHKLLGAEAHYRMGEYYSKERNAGYNLKAAFQRYFKAAFLGHAEAMYEVGNFYYQGQVVSYNLIEAENWYRMAADKGSASAEWGMTHVIYDYWLAELHRTGGQSNARTEYLKKEMLYWRKRAAAHGHPNALFELGIDHIEGIDVQQDDRTGLKLIIKAADMGCGEAVECLNEDFYRHLRKKLNL